jgi:hypothetical protein
VLQCDLSHVTQVEETLERISELKQRFQNMTQFVQIHFDHQRNIIMRLNFVAALGAVARAMMRRMTVRVGSLSLGFMATGASLFGMNILNGYALRAESAQATLSMGVGSSAIRWRFRQ